MTYDGNAEQRDALQSIIAHYCEMAQNVREQISRKQRTFREVKNAAEYWRGIGELQNELLRLNNTVSTLLAVQMELYPAQGHKRDERREWVQAMSDTKKFYIERINALMIDCADVPLLSVIYKILSKEAQP